MKVFGYWLLGATVIFLFVALLQKTSIEQYFGSGLTVAQATKEMANAFVRQIIFLSVSGLCFSLGIFLTALGTFQDNMIKEMRAILAQLKGEQTAPKEPQGNSIPEDSKAQDAPEKPKVNVIYGA